MIPPVFPDSKISEFLDRVKGGGASDQAAIGMLLSRGWPEKEINEALARYYERTTGVEIPRRSAGAGAGSAAKEAFYYLLIFATLATWTIGLGRLAFALIDRWLGDPLFLSGSGSYSMTAAVASLLVSFPIYLLVSRIVIRDERAHPEKQVSSVRKWLTYMALVLAACVFMGDLIVSLTYLLRGEITSRFLLKALVVLAVSGGVFLYYYGGVRKPEASESQKRFNRNSYMAILSAFSVAAVVFLGFWQIGGPNAQRRARADERRAGDLYQISRQIDALWNSSHVLPSKLDILTPGPPTDPVTGAAYGYRAVAGSEYSLCATFAESRRDDSPSGQWSHPAGWHCFSLNAAQTVTSLPSFPE